MTYLERDASLAGLAELCSAKMLGDYPLLVRVEEKRKGLVVAAYLRGEVDEKKVLPRLSAPPHPPPPNPAPRSSHPSRPTGRLARFRCPALVARIGSHRACAHRWLGRSTVLPKRRDTRAK